MTVRAAIGLGSNLGDRRGRLQEAGRRLGAAGRIVASSSLYETEPIGGPDQGPYLNAVVLLDTDLTPEELMASCLEIEAALGRERRVRWGPRTIDLDILLYGDTVIDRPGLRIPHPRMLERRFVLEPLLEVWPDAPLPEGRDPADALAAVSDQVVKKVTERHLPPMAAAIVFVVTGIAAVVVWQLLGRLL